jgi:hypothetical protein
MIAPRMLIRMRSAEDGRTDPQKEMKGVSHFAKAGGRCHALMPAATSQPDDITHLMTSSTW